MTELPDSLTERLVKFLLDLKYMYKELTDNDTTTLNEILVLIQQRYGQRIHHDYVDNNSNANSVSSDTTVSNIQKP